MYRDYRLYLEDILEAIRKIKEYTDKTDFSTFSKDTKTQDAVVRNLEIIGEASGRIPEKIRQLAPGIEWRKIVGIRNILAHEYFGISLPIVWDVVQNKLDELSAVCGELIAGLDDEGINK